MAEPSIMTDDRHQGLEVEAPEVQEKVKARSRNEEFGLERKKHCREEESFQEMVK